MMNHQDNWPPLPRYPFATKEERAAGARVDSVGHTLHLGDAMTCMCCGADYVVGEEHLRADDESFDYDGSQWVRTPEWVERLRHGPKRPERPRPAPLQCTCGANVVTVGLAGTPQHAPDCALNQVVATNVEGRLSSRRCQLHGGVGFMSDCIQCPPGHGLSATENPTEVRGTGRYGIRILDSRFATVYGGHDFVGSHDEASALAKRWTADWLSEPRYPHEHVAYVVTPYTADDQAERREVEDWLREHGVEPDAERQP